ncbi:MAG: class I SAM-dependent methyltransferase [Candidatus Peribacteraceae bacterium]
MFALEKEISTEQLQEAKCPLCNTSSSRLIFSEGIFSVVQCDACDIQFEKRQLDKNGLQKIYNTHEYWSSSSPRSFGYASYLRESKNYLRTFALRIKGTPELTKKVGSVLDIGCGCGYFLEKMQERGWKCSGIDISKEASDEALKRANLHIQTGDESLLEGMESRFDIVSLWDVIEHLPEPVKSLKRIRNIIQPGGLLILETQNFQSFFARLLGKRWHHYKHLEHLWHFSPQSIEQILKQAGFRVVRSSARHGGKYVSLGFIAERAKRIHPWLGLMLEKCAYPVRHWSLYVNLFDEMIVIAEPA